MLPTSRRDLTVDEAHRLIAELGRIGWFGLAHVDSLLGLGSPIFGCPPKRADSSLWSQPETRKKLLRGLAEKGFGAEQLAEMQKIIDTERSDLFDVLAHVAYAPPPESREVRDARAQVAIHAEFTSKKQAFLDFVLAHYVREGVQEPDQEKRAPLLKLRY